MGQKKMWGRTTIGGIEKRNRPSLGNAWGELSVCVRVRSYPHTSRSSHCVFALYCLVVFYCVCFCFVFSCHFVLCVFFFIIIIVLFCWLVVVFWVIVVVVVVLGFGAVIIIFVLSYDVAVVCRPIRQSPPTDD